MNSETRALRKVKLGTVSPLIIQLKKNKNKKLPQWHTMHHTMHVSDNEKKSKE